MFEEQFSSSIYLAWEKKIEMKETLISQLCLYHKIGKTAKEMFQRS